MTKIPEDIGNQLNVLQVLYNKETDATLKKAFETKILQIQESLLRDMEKKADKVAQVAAEPPAKKEVPPCSTETIDRAEKAGFKFSADEKKSAEEYEKQHPVVKMPGKFVVTLADGTKAEYPVSPNGEVTWADAIPGSRMRRSRHCEWNLFEETIRNTSVIRIVSVETA